MGSLGAEINIAGNNYNNINNDDHIDGIEIWSNSEDINISGNSKLPLLSLNHVSFVCKSVSHSARFYEEVLGFVLIKRPSSFKFQGAWLFNYGIGIHLLESNTIQPKKEKINPKDNHISFQCSDMSLVMQKLEDMNIQYVTAVVEEGGVIVDQLFFHDPDGYMIEICNCQNLPVLPLSSSCPLKLNLPTATTTTTTTTTTALRKPKYCSGEAAAVMMMDNLLVEMMNISM